VKIKIPLTAVSGGFKDQPTRESSHLTLASLNFGLTATVSRKLREANHKRD